MTVLNDTTCIAVFLSASTKTQDDYYNQKEQINEARVCLSSKGH